MSGVTIRLALEPDAPGLARLAALDSSRVPAAPVLVAEVGGELWAARSLATGAAVADPFHPTADLLELLAGRARQLAAAEGRVRRQTPRWLRRPRPA